MVGEGGGEVKKSIRNVLLLLVTFARYCGIGCYQGADGSWYLTQLFAG